MDNWCDINNKPIDSQTCNLGACFQPLSMADAFVWRTSEWQTVWMILLI